MCSYERLLNSISIFFLIFKNVKTFNQIIFLLFKANQIVFSCRERHCLLLKNPFDLDALEKKNFGYFYSDRCFR